MKRLMKRMSRLTIVAMLIAAMMSAPALAASTATSVTTIRFRTAVVNQIKNSGGIAEVTRGGKTMEIYEGMRLYSSDRLVTQGNISIYILVDQDKIVRLDPDSSAVLNDTFFGRRVKITLKSGSMFFNVVEKLPENDSMQFVYGNITISVRGTSALLNGNSGAFGMVLLDGVVEATETGSQTDVNGAPVTKVLTIEPGTKFQYAPGTEENGGQASMEVGSFTIKDLPASVVEEMKNDEQLAARIIGSVPMTENGGNEQYADINTLDLNTIGVPDRVAMAPSPEIAKTAGIEVPVFTAEDLIVQQEPVRSEPAEEPVKPEPQPEEPKQPEPQQPELFVCPVCGREATQEELDTEHDRMECGHYSCQTEDGSSHERLACGHFRCEVGEEGLEGHQQVPCGECMYTILNERSWIEHISVRNMSKFKTMPLCSDEFGDMDNMRCPLCGLEDITRGEFLNGDHCVYDEKNHCLTCGGVRQNSDWFVAKFLRPVFNRRTYGSIMRHFGIEIYPDVYFNDTSKGGNDQGEDGTSGGENGQEENGSLPGRPGPNPPVPPGPLMTPQ